MRILDNTGDKALDDVLILLTKQEAKYMRELLDQLLAEKELDHDHLLDHDGVIREITIALYDKTNIEANPYTERVLRLIQSGK